MMQSPLWRLWRKMLVQLLDTHLSSKFATVKLSAINESWRLVVIHIRNATVDMAHPSVVESFFDGDTLLGIGMCHLIKETLQWRLHVGEDSSSRKGRFASDDSSWVIVKPLVKRGLVCSIHSVAGSGFRPWETSVVKSDIDDGARPNIKFTSVIGIFLGNNLWREVRLAAADSWTAEMDILHVGAAFHLLAESWVVSAEDFRDTEIRDLESSIRAQEKVLRFDISVSNTMAVEISNTTQKLFENAELLISTHEILLDD